jgi:proteasome lid subunit RPN8/RPN11
VTFYDKIRRHAEDSPQREVCGLLVRGHGAVKEPVVCPTANLHPDPRCFQIPDAEVRHFMREGRLVGFYHSHYQDPAVFSDVDRQSAEQARLPLFVYSLVDKQFNLYRPTSVTPSMEGRDFLLGLNDCIQIVTEWMLTNRNLVIPYVERTWDNVRAGCRSWGPILTQAGLRSIPPAEAQQVGDVLVFACGTTDPTSPNHTGIIISPGVFLHQMYGRLSCTASLIEWQDRIVQAYRI